MSRILNRAAAIVAGMALPLSAWALVAPVNVDEEYVAAVEQVAAEVSIATVEPSGSMEVEAGMVRADRADHLGDEAVRPDASTTGCCVWIYYNGRWYCYPCT